MATSNDFGTSNQYINYKISVSTVSQSVSNNSSRVTVSVRFYRTNQGYTTYGSGTVYCTINGTKYSAAVGPSQKITSSGIVLFSKTVDIKHESDGSKNLTCSAYISHSQFSSSSNSYSVTLSSIPRASKFGTISGNQIGSNMTVNITRYSSSFTHGLWYKVGTSGWQTVASSGIGTSSTFQINMSMCSQLTNSTSGTLTLMLKTYSGSKQIGDTIYKTVTVYVPSSVKPSCRIALSDANGYAATYGGYIVGLSKIKSVITATTSYGSSIASYSSTIEGVTYNGSTVTSNTIKNSGSLSVKATVKDKRGRSGTATASYTALAYNYPKLTKLTVHRCNSDGTDNDKGEHVKVVFSYSVTSLNSKNTVNVTMQYRKSGTPTYTTVNFSDLSTVYSVTDKSVVIAADSGSSYDIVLSIKDNFKTTKRETSVSTAFTLMHFNKSGNGMAIGKLSETEDLFDIGMDTMFRGNIYGNVVGLNGVSEIPANSDMNNYLIPGCWACVSNETVKTIKNIPLNTAAFKIIVESAAGGTVTATGWAAIRQRFIPYRDYAIYERIITRGSDGKTTYEQWYRISLTKTAADFVYGSHDYQPKHEPHMLWSGGLYMTEGHTVTFSEKASAQPNGIVLVFSPYKDGAAQPYSWQSFYISKAHIKTHNGNGNEFLLAESNFSYVGRKYLYVFDDKITGNANNALTGTASSGIKYANNRFVLRHVIGV